MGQINLALGVKNHYSSVPANLIFFINFKDFESSDSVISPSHFIYCSSWSFGRGKSSKREITLCF